MSRQVSDESGVVLDVISVVLLKVATTTCDFLAPKCEGLLKRNSNALEGVTGNKVFCDVTSNELR